MVFAQCSVCAIYTVATAVLDPVLRYRSIRRGNYISRAWRYEFKIQPQIVGIFTITLIIMHSTIDYVPYYCRAIRTICVSDAQQKFLYWRHAGNTACAIRSRVGCKMKNISLHQYGRLRTGTKNICDIISA